jgi:hypothetical protein
LAYDSKDDQSTTKGDSAYRWLDKEIQRPSATKLASGGPREILDAVLNLDMKTEATVDLRDHVHGSAKLPKSGVK